ncbi:MAG: exosortase [Candidatus Eisenbacteria bacterium]
MSKLRLVAIAILLALLYLKPVATLAERWWRDADYSHGFVVAAVSLFVALRESRRARGRRTGSGGEGQSGTGWGQPLGAQGTRMGLALLIPGLVLYVLGTAGAEEFSTRVSLLPVLAGTMFLVGGKLAGSSLLFPIFFFGFAVPLPEVIYFSVTSPLQTLAARLGTALAGSVGLVALREGNIVHVGGVSLGVAEACSGLRSLMAYFALSVLLAWYVQRGWLRKAILVLVTPVIAVSANALRLFVASVGAVAVGPGFLKGVQHEISGVVTFFVGVGALLAFSELLRWSARKTAA